MNWISSGMTGCLFSGATVGFHASVEELSGIIGDETPSLYPGSTSMTGAKDVLCESISTSAIA